ncbi:sulfotransferase [Pedobacter sp. GSP4]|uniref:sulfotransferase n=1 Tax=Pedobacter sp. GSP4 TaxID=3453716 RepID=UPI003EEF700F
MNTLHSNIYNWIPYQLATKDHELTCRWLYTDGAHFTGPFFSESMGKCMSHPFNARPYRPYSHISVLPEWATGINSLTPTAFIFHVSRCGSTLISQSLSLNKQHIVLPEAPFIDEMLRFTKNDNWPSTLNREQILKAVFSLYGQNPTGDKKHLFIKTDSWHIHFMPLLRKLYPNTPFILLYRKPDEIIRSHQKLRGMQAVPGVVPDEFLGIEPGSVANINLDEHITRVLEIYLDCFIQWSQNDPLALLVNYNEGIMDMMHKLCNITGIELDTNDWEQIKLRSKFNAKHPEQLFNELQPDEQIAPYQQAVFKRYNQLEQLRASQAVLQ